MKRDSNYLVNSILYKQIVGSLKYLCVIRPNIVYGVGLISRFMESSKRSHYLVAKKILRYVKRTHDQGLLFTNNIRSNKVGIVGFSDSDWFGDQDDRRSTLGHLFSFVRTAISWCLKK